MNIPLNSLPTDPSERNLRIDTPFATGMAPRKIAMWSMYQLYDVFYYLGQTDFAEKLGDEEPAFRRMDNDCFVMFAYFSCQKISLDQKKAMLEFFMQEDTTPHAAALEMERQIFSIKS
jgi:hypothetical protein